MREVEKHLYGMMVDMVESVSLLVEDAAKNKLRKRSEIFSAINEARSKTKEFNVASKGKHAKTLITVRRPLTKLLTVLDALESGVKSGEYNLTSFRQELRKHLLPLKESLVAASSKMYPSKLSDEEFKAYVNHVAKTKGTREALAVLKQAEENRNQAQDEAEEANVEDMRSEISKYLAYRNKLPSSLGGKLFSVVRMPIVPLTTSNFHIMTSKFLRRTGLKFNAIEESFVVLEDQVLLAFDTTKIEEKSKAPMFNEQGLKARKRRAKNQTNHETFVLDIVDRINEASPEKYELVTSTFLHAPGTRRVAYAWLLPRQAHAMFARNADMSRLSWGFPWTREAHSVL